MTTILEKYILTFIYLSLKKLDKTKPTNFYHFAIMCQKFCCMIQNSMQEYN